MPTAIPIPSRRQPQLATQSTVSSTTPSLQSVLLQRKFSHQSLKSSCLSSNSTLHRNHNNNTQSNNNNNDNTSNEDDDDNTPSSLPSLLSLSSLDSSESHPLESLTLMDDIDQNFFNFSDNRHAKQLELEILKPIHSTPTLRQIHSKESMGTKMESLSFVSNLTRSIKSFTNSTLHQNKDLLFGIQPRLTDDRIPQGMALQKSKHHHDIQHVEQELETYKITARNSTVLSSSPSMGDSAVSVFRNKEPRINSQFLRLYAYEASSRKKGLLPEISQDEENELLYHQQQQPQPVIDSNSMAYMSQKEFAIIVRQRLWNCVVLPPKDEQPCFNNPEYVYCNNMVNPQDEANSLMKEVGTVKPWVKLDDEENYRLSDVRRNTVLKPRGKLYNNVQFIVKGWCNSRWIPTDSS